MYGAVPAKRADALSGQTDETRRIVSSILEQIPDLLRVKRVRKPDGSTVDFASEKIGLSFSRALDGVGIDDSALLARCTHQALMRLDREFDGHTVPTTDDIARIIALVLLDNNLHFAVKSYLDRRGAPIRQASQATGPGLRLERVFSYDGTHPFDGIEWEIRDAVLTDAQGQKVFEQRGVEVPKSWSQSATNIVASKYFRGELGKPERESSVRQIVSRVAKTIADHGRASGYFASATDADVFEDELTAILVDQRAAFNSPVWFNVGVNVRPQCSACFINSVDDNMRSILNLAVTEGMLFKYGSGTGSNLSRLRSSRERLSNSSGKSSGPVSFMRGYDAFAGVIKSGGKTRRAAKMVILNADHPDIEEFVTCKAREERKAKTLVAAGYDGSMDGEAYSSIFFQNANNSVRVTDEFMRAVIEDGDWQTRAITTGETVDTVPARRLMRRIAEAAWECGDPGMQFDTTVNRWHTSANSGRINASNPCSEFMFLDDSACNLASLNLMKFYDPEKGFDVTGFRQATEVMITAMEIVVGLSSYPTPAIEENSHGFRPLGIGYANLGALLMAQGLAYDSEEGRNCAAAVTALLSGLAYRQSARLAETMGPFRYYQLNERPFLKVIGLHRDQAYAIPEQGVSPIVREAARRSWDEALEAGMSHGYRNAQVSLLAPTGTIGFLMDCDTTGIEPDIALVKYKWLVGGGLMKIVNRTVRFALDRLGYDADQAQEILGYLDREETIEGAPHLKEEHLPVFDCAFRPAKGSRSINYMGHIRMMAAVQPLLSGAISKTVNMPHEATVEDVENAYIESWKTGLKAVAIYRDGSKGQQVLTTTAQKDGVAANPDGGGRGQPDSEPAETATAAKREVRGPLRRRMPDERRSLTHKFSVAGHRGYITVGLYADGTPGEIFIRMAKGGSVVSGLMDSFATSTSIALQYGVPLRVLIDKFIHVRFEPSGFTNNPNIRIAKSIVDYIFRWLAMKFLSSDELHAIGINAEAQTLAEQGQADVDASNEERSRETEDDDAGSAKQMHLGETPQAAEGARTADSLTMSFDTQSDAPPCDTCGAMMVRNGSCYKCLNCGSTSGCS